MVGSNDMPFPRCAAAVLAVLLPLSLAHGVVLGGGGSTSKDCLVVLEGNFNDPPPPDKPKRYRCQDGDPCDADGTVNGVCAFDLTVCANSSYNPNVCSLVGVTSITVDHAVDNGDRKFDPDFQALQSRIADGIIDVGDPPNTTPDVCALASRLLIPVVGPLPGNVCRPSKKKLKLTSFSVPMLGVIRKDVDKMTFECDPAPAGCTPRVFFADTFDRIQRQVFNQRCALSGCHDSQTHQNNLVLEEGSSYNSLVDATPTNTAAQALLWKRIDAANMSTDTSYLYHKITGDLPGGDLGARMPLTGGMLDQALIDIIKLWIEAGAPQGVWVAGTDQ
jgi:hypothetical protein